MKENKGSYVMLQVIKTLIILAMAIPVLIGVITGDSKLIIVCMAIYAAALLYFLLYGWFGAGLRAHGSLPVISYIPGLQLLLADGYIVPIWIRLLGLLVLISFLFTNTVTALLSFNIVSFNASILYIVSIVTTAFSYLVQSIISFKYQAEYSIEGNISVLGIFLPGYGLKVAKDFEAEEEKLLNVNKGLHKG